MNRRWFVLILALVLLPAAAGASPSAEPAGLEAASVTQPAAQCSAQGGSLGHSSLAGALFPQQPFWAGNCTLYHRCICQCQQQGVCCRNGCWSQPDLSGCTNQCYDDEYACEDVCIANYVSDGTVCGNTNCSIDPFCNAP